MRRTAKKSVTRVEEEDIRRGLPAQPPDFSAQEDSRMTRRGQEEDTGTTKRREEEESRAKGGQRGQGLETDWLDKKRTRDSEATGRRQEEEKR